MNTEIPLHQCLQHYAVTLTQVESIVLSPLLAVEKLTTENGITEKDWLHTAQTFEWTNIPSELLRAIAFKIHDKEHSQHIMLLIIATRKLHLEDYDEMASTFRHPQVKWNAKEAIHRAATKYNRMEDGLRIYRKLYPQNFGRQDNSLQEENPAGYMMWYRIMYAK